MCPFVDQAGIACGSVFTKYLIEGVSFNQVIDFPKDA